MHQCSFINWNTCTTWQRMTVVGRAVCRHDQKVWQISQLSTWFCCEPKTALCCCCCCLVAKLHPTLLQPHGLWPARLLSPWDLPGKNTGAGCHFLLQGIFSTQGLNPHLLRLLHCRQITTEPSGEPIALCHGYFTALSTIPLRFTDKRAI